MQWRAPIQSRDRKGAVFRRDHIVTVLFYASIVKLTGPERTRAIALLKEFLNDRSSIVKTCALQGLAELAHGKPELQLEVVGIMEQASRTGTPAMKARVRKLLR